MLGKINGLICAIQIDITRYLAKYNVYVLPPFENNIPNEGSEVYKFYIL